MRSPLLWLAIACHLFFATSYAFSTPSFEGPDENSHYEYAWSLANNGHLPLAPALAAARGLPQTEGAVLAHHPPLYYTLLAGCLVAAHQTDTVFGPLLHDAFGQPGQSGRHLRFLHGGDEAPPRARGQQLLFGLRLVSVLLGLLSVLAVFALGRAACPSRPRIAEIAALLVSCLPMWSFLHGVLNSDNLATLLATLTLLALVRLVRAETPSWRGALGLGVLLGLALLTKLTTLFLLPLTMIAFVQVSVRAARVGRGRHVLHLAAATTVTTLALSGWCFWRNWQLYGDPLALAVHDAAFPPIDPAYVWPYFWHGFLPDVFSSLLGRFGWFALPPPPALVWFGGAVAVLALLGLVRHAFDRPRGEVPRPLWLLLGAAALVFAGTAHFNLKAPQPQGRLLFPAIGPAALVLATGLLRLGAWLRIGRFAVWFAAVPPLLAGAVFFWWFLPAFDPALAQAPPHHSALVGDILTKVDSPGITWLPAEPTAASTTPPLLRWSNATATADTIYSLYAFDDRGRIWLATHEWSHGDIVLRGGEARLPEAAWSLLPTDRELRLVLRRVPDWRAGERLPDMPKSAPLPYRRE